MKSQILKSILRVFALTRPYNPRVSQPTKPETDHTEIQNLERRLENARAAHLLLVYGRFYR